MTKEEILEALRDNDAKWLKSKSTYEKRRAFLAKQHTELSVKLMEQAKQ